MVSSYHCMWGSHEIKLSHFTKEVRLREAKGQGLTSWKWQSQDTNRGNLASEFVFLSMTWHCLSIAHEMKKVLCKESWRWWWWCEILRSRKASLRSRKASLRNWHLSQDLNGAREAIWGKGKCKGTEAWCVQGTERRLVWLEWRYGVVRDKTTDVKEGDGGEHEDEITWGLVAYCKASDFYFWVRQVPPEASVQRWDCRVKGEAVLTIHVGNGGVLDQDSSG